MRIDRAGLRALTFWRSGESFGLFGHMLATQSEAKQLIENRGHTGPWLTGIPADDANPKVTACH
jgi:hypothetical protein